MENQTNNYPTNDSFTLGKNFIPHFLIGMVIGVGGMLIVGSLINNLGLGITLGPAIGTAMGFLLHALLNRKGDQNNQPIPAKTKNTLIVLLVLGMFLLIAASLFIFIN